jgi:hypothetical protein
MTAEPMPTRPAHPDQALLDLCARAADFERQIDAR